MWIVVGLLIFNVLFWMVVYYAQQASKNLGATEVTNKAFYEPTINLGTLMSVCCLLYIIQFFTGG